MAASSSGSGTSQSDMMESSTEESGGASCLEITFEEFLRHRQSEMLQGRGQQPANVEVDESPLKPSLNRNKESLKLKLQMRRNKEELELAGILPSPNTPPAFACQRVKLERARMGDLLKAKIQQRPTRQELVRQHILEETDSRVAPLLAEKQRMLKRARLADSLNDHLIHRPGPLELVQKNILHIEAPDESIEKAIKDGIVPFKATCEGATPGPSHPTKYICQEDDSSSDVSSPSVNLDSVSVEENAETPAPVSVPDSSVPEPVVDVQNKVSAVVPPVPPPPPPPPPYPFTISEVQSTPQPQPNLGIFAVPIFSSTQAQSVVPQPQPVFHSSQLSSASGKSRSKKISKSKSQSKPKTIKFHEYKGPPNAQKSGSNSMDQKRPPESSYELLLQQQQLFLQWQLEWQHRFPKILLPAVSKMSTEEKKAFCSSLQSSSSSFPSSVSHHHNLQNLHPVVSESLPVQIISNPANSVLILSSTEPSSNTHPTLTYVPQQPAPLPQPQTATTLVITTPTTTTSSQIESEKCETKIPLKLNDWKVNELKAELKKRNLPVSGSKSQLLERLQASYSKDKESKNGNESESQKSEDVKDATGSQQPELKFFITSNNSTTTLLNPGALEFLQKSGILAATDNKDLSSSEGVVPVQPSSRSVLQQKIQQKLQQQQAIKTQLNLNSQNKPDAVTNGVVVNELRTWIPSSSKNQEDVVIKNPVGETKPKNSEDPWVLKITEANTGASFENCLADLLSEDAPQRATTVHHGVGEGLDHVKSQMVDDVLEILIRNGELPASAAQHIVAQSSSKDFKPPPAPPLPPSTFAVTLPTEISYRRTNSHQEEHPIPQRKGSLLGISLLTKDAAEILKISEELATFGKQPFTIPVNVVKKQEESMELEDNLGNLNGEKPKSIINGDSIVIDELLTEDLDLPMDTEYSDWLEKFESFSNDNAFNNFNNHKIDKSNEDSHNNTRERDPLLSSTKTLSNRLTINNFPVLSELDGSGNIHMDIDTSTGNSTETDLLKIRKEDNANLNNDLWDFSF